jgi:hypothetical protein
VTATKKWWGAEFGRNCENPESVLEIHIRKQPGEHEDQKTRITRIIDVRSLGATLYHTPIQGSQGLPHISETLHN